MRGGFRRGQGELGDSAEHFALLGRILAEAAGIDGAAASVGWHGAQGLDSVAHSLLALRRQAADLRIYLPSLLFLRGSEVLPGFHAVEHALLLLGRQAVEAVQAFQQALLALGRQAAELRIAVKRLALLGGRNVLIAAQPLPGVMSLRRMLWRMRWLMLLLLGRRFRYGLVLRTAVGEGRERAGKNQRPRGTSRLHAFEFQSRHVPSLPVLLSPILSGPWRYFCFTLQLETQPVASYGFAVTSDCTCRSSSTSKLEYRS